MVKTEDNSGYSDGRPTKAPLFTLDRSTLVPLGLLVAVVLSSITATVWINTRLLNIEHTLQRLEENTRERWTFGDMRAWASLLAAKNSTLVVPDPIQLNGTR